MSVCINYSHGIQISWCWHAGTSVNNLFTYLHASNLVQFLPIFIQPSDFLYADIHLNGLKARNCWQTDCFFFWLTCNHLDVCMQTDWLATVEWLTDYCFRCKQLKVCMQTTLDGLHATNCMETDCLATILFSLHAGIWMSGCWLTVCLAFMWASGCLHAEWLCVWLACKHLDVCMQTDWLDANM